MVLVWMLATQEDVPDWQPHPGLLDGLRARLSERVSVEEEARRAVNALSRLQSLLAALAHNVANRCSQAATYQRMSLMGMAPRDRNGGFRVLRGAAGVELGFSGAVLAKGLGQEQEANPRLKLERDCPILSKRIILQRAILISSQNSSLKQLGSWPRLFQIS
jgi:hypothetical protein